MSRPIIPGPLIGTAAQHVYLRHADDDLALNLLESMLPLSYELHYGLATRELIARALRDLRSCTTEDEVDEVFARSRREFHGAGMSALLTKEKDGGWTRTMRTSGLEDLVGSYVDVGNPSNKFGDFLMRHRPTIYEVTGVDSRRDPDLMLGEHLHFAWQEDESVIPLRSGSADRVGFRLALHHMTTEVQEALLREARRILRPGGEVLIIEDSFDNTPALNDSALTMQFDRLPEDSKYAFLSMLDASSNLVKAESIPFPFTYRSVSQWKALLVSAGFVDASSTYWGFPMFTPYNAPMGIVRARVG